MTWNYRIVKRKDSTGEYFFAVHEAYYNKNNKISSITEEPIKIIGNDVEEIFSEIDMIKKDLERSKNDIIDYDNIKFEKP